MIRCPLYKGHSAKQIVCDGDSSEIWLSYRRKTDNALQIKVFCMEHYACCEIYQMVSRRQAATHGDTPSGIE